MSLVLCAACDYSTHVRLNSSRFMDTGVTPASSALPRSSIAVYVVQGMGGGWRALLQSAHYRGQSLLIFLTQSGLQAGNFDIIAPLPAERGAMPC